MSDLLFDVTRLLARGVKGRLPTGIDRVDLAYLKHFAPRARAVLQVAGRPLVLTSRGSRKIFDLLSHFDRGSILKAAAIAAAALPEFEPVAEGTVYLNTSHSGLLGDGFARRLARREIRAVWMVHDLIPITHPEYCRAGEELRHRRRMETALRCASALLVNSRSTSDTLASFARSLGHPMPPVTVAPLATDLNRTADPRRPLAEPYFLVVATIEPRKNLAMLLQLWRRLAERMRRDTPRLVLVGQRGWECENVVDLLDRCPELRGLVVELPRCRDEELASWYAHAQALLFPSFVEGFGLPLAEALSLGTPVIASDLPVFREVAGSIPEYVDPLDAIGWQQRIEAYAQHDSEERAGQLQRMAGYRAPRWSEHFAVVDGLVDRLTGAGLAAQPALERA